MYAFAIQYHNRANMQRFKNFCTSNNIRYIIIKRIALYTGRHKLYIMHTEQKIDICKKTITYCSGKKHGVFQQAQVHSAGKVQSSCLQTTHHANLRFLEDSARKKAFHEFIPGVCGTFPQQYMYIIYIYMDLYMVYHGCSYNHWDVNGGDRRPQKGGKAGSLLLIETERPWMSPS